MGEARGALEMDLLAGNPPSLSRVDLSYTQQGYYIAQQAHEPYGSHSVLSGSAVQMQALDEQVIVKQGQLSHSFDPSPALHINEPHNAESFGDTQTTSALTIGPPSRPRKRKAPTLRASAWEPYKARIIELHTIQGLPLKKVKERIEEEFSFTAEIRQYRTRISQWGKDKNIKPQEMRAIVRKRQQRNLVDVERSELVFEIRGDPVEPQKIDRWMKRNGVPESLLYAPSPAALGCRTVSERGSSFPSPAYSVTTPVFSPGGIASVAQSPLMFSPALSIASIVQPQSSVFNGQSPAFTYQSLPAYPIHSLATLNASHGLLDIAVGSTQYRYRQKDEERLLEELSRAEILFGNGHSETLDVLFTLGNVLKDQGRYKSAEGVSLRLVKGYQIAGGNNDVNTLKALELLGQVLARQGLYSKAEKLHQRTLESKKAILGDEHPSTLASIGNLALTYRNQGRWKEAEELEVQVMETSKRVLGDEHPSTLASIGNLASTYCNQGQWKKAEELEVQVMETKKRVLGDEHPDTLASIGNLASTYMNQGQWKEAEELNVQVMETSKRVLGDEHPDTLTSIGNLASTYRNQGRWKKAEELEVQVMETSKRVLGDEHPSTLASIGNLASTYWNQGRWKKTEELEVQVMEIRKRVLGDEHPSTLTSINNLASTYRNQGRWKEAEELDVQVMEMRKRVLGDEHPDTLASIGNLASTYRNQGQWKEAEELEVQVIETKKRVLGDEHPSTLTSIGNLASTYWNQGWWKEAEELEVQVMEASKRVLGDEHPSTLTSMNNLAITLKSLGHHDRAISTMHTCVRLRMQVLSANHPRTVSSLDMLNTWRMEMTGVTDDCFNSKGSRGYRVSICAQFLRSQWYFAGNSLGSMAVERRTRTAARDRRQHIALDSPHK
ncbi:hypothetical protein B0J11DRAFT_572773 [Dendryphion nanum]|uniref:Clr5 domain-containing protein n=1 Tax=Dendryphion nanum TaxID=256645 RepID=A0A9P9D655_9PLEO|nr:hypothetical protein B0J11DRAFT_572773 [Dendryphion nanum]